METKKREWNIQNSKTRSIGVRIPNEDFKRFERFMEANNLSISKATCLAISFFLDNMDDGEKGENKF